VAAVAEVVEAAVVVAVLVAVLPPGSSWR
jgi:hypothetical protein